MNYRSANPWAPRQPWWRRIFSGMPPVTAWLLRINIVLFAVFAVGGWLRLPGVAVLEYLLALSPAGMKAHFYWQPVTYMFLHAGLWHVLLNMLTLSFMGPETERSMGSLHFGIMYFLSGIVGGLGWLLLTASGPRVPCVGATGPRFRVKGAVATHNPRRRQTISRIFNPVTTEAWKMVLGLAVFQFLFMLDGASGGIAYAAHVAGAFAGFLYIDQLYESAHFRRLVRSVAGWFGSAFSPRTPSGRQAPPPGEDEVNRILDKIAREGIGSLTREERDTLHRASSKF